MLSLAVVYFLGFSAVRFDPDLTRILSPSPPVEHSTWWCSGNSIACRGYVSKKVTVAPSPKTILSADIVERTLRVAERAEPKAGHSLQAALETVVEDRYHLLGGCQAVIV